MVQHDSTPEDIAASIRRGAWSLLVSDLRQRAGRCYAYSLDHEDAGDILAQLRALATAAVMFRMAACVEFWADRGQTTPYPPRPRP